MIMGSVFGLQHIPGFPFIFDQSFGVCVGVLIITLWGSTASLADRARECMAGTFAPKAF